MTLYYRLSSRCAALWLACASLTLVPALSAAERTAPKEAELIQVLRSDAPPQDKAITCKKLAIYGSHEAVPALAPLLADESLASWARIALEVIPDAAADEALRAAVSKVQGRLLIGVLNSIGVRRDAQAVPALAAKLNDANGDVAAAAAEALGHIGGPAAASALEDALTHGRPVVQPAVGYGCVLCAERFLTDGKNSEAARLYDQVRQAKVPKQRILEATRGAILARGSAGIPLLLEQLHSADMALVGIGLRTARELPGREVTDALAAEFDKAGADRQVPLLLALADRNDSSVLPKLLQIAESGPKGSRISALGLLDRFRDLSAVPVLLSAASDADTQVAAPARTTLARLGGKEVDADLLARLRLASGKNRQVLIDLAKQRRIAGALPIIVRSADDPDSGIRRSAIEAIGVLGTTDQAPDLVRLLSAAQSQEEREDAETALTSISGRSGPKSLEALLPLFQNSDGAMRIVSLHALAAAGGRDALALLRKALVDNDEAVRDEAVRTLANWPNTWPEDSDVAEPLLDLAKNGKKPSHRLQGLQGYFQHVQETKKLSGDEKLAKVKELLPNLSSPEEKRLAIAVLGTITTAGALDQLIEFTNDSAVVEEACQAVLRIATDRGSQQAPAEARRKALQVVMNKSESDATKQRATQVLGRIK